jgi:predicted transcriptional regulator
MSIKPKYAETDIHGNELSDKQKQYLEDNEIKLDPFDKRNWKTAESRDKWRDVMQKAAEAKREAEWRSVMEGSTDRKAAIIHITNTSREKWLRRLSQEDLVYRDIRFTKPYGGFSHKTFPTSHQDPERMTYSVIAQNEDIADKMVEAEQEMQGPDGHEVIGELLGFPKCCRDYFNEYFIEKQFKDPMYESACNTAGVEKVEGNPHHLKVPNPHDKINPMWRYFGWSFITHLPCSLDCDRSKEVAEQRKQIMLDNGYDEAVEALEEWLGLPSVWSGKAGLMHIVNKHFIGSARTSDYWKMKKITWKKKNLPGGSILDD